MAFGSPTDPPVGRRVHRPLFVYGTLKRGEAREALCGPGARTEAVVRGTLYALPAGYPALTLRGSGAVHGELVALADERVLRLLDHYEGVDEGLFMRVEVEAIVGLRRVPAWAYIMDDPRFKGGKALRSGVWTAARRR